MKRCTRAALLIAAATACLSPALANPQGKGPRQTVEIDAEAPSHAFPHFWEQMFGSGRAALALRESYRQDLAAVKDATDLQYVRFHAIFHDELGVYDEDKAGAPLYNFSYVDQIYDGLLARGVKPFVEVGLMPDKMAAHVTPFIYFWYKPDISPPKDYAKWDALITAFVKHLVERYGATEVASWYFEVWNEPNFLFWAGDPAQASYFELYDHTANAIKAVDPRFRVGGPATAQSAWIPEFIAHAKSAKTPIDFISSHGYADDPAKEVLGVAEAVPRQDMLCRAVKKVKAQIAGSQMPKLPLIWSEFNATYMNKTEVTDSAFMGPWLGETISKCDGLTKMMSYWTFSDVFEEQGVYKMPLYGGYGLIAPNGLIKPAYNAFKLLHKLGETRINVRSDNVLATRRADGTLALAVWNYAQAEDDSNKPIRITLRLKHVSATTAAVYRVDADHGDLHSAYAKMGSPRYPTSAQIQQLRVAATLPPAEQLQISGNLLRIDLPSKGLALVEIR